MELGININKLRKEKEFTQEQLADCVGVSIAAVSKWETGSAYPDIELLPKLAEVFGVSVDYLLGYDMKKADMTIDDHIKVAEQYIENRQNKKAVEYFNEIAVRYPNNTKVKLNQARFMIRGTYGNNSTPYHKQLLQEAERILLSLDEAKLTHGEYEQQHAELCFLYNYDKQYVKALESLNHIKMNTVYNFEAMECMIYTSMGDNDAAAKKTQEYILKSFVSLMCRICDFYMIYYDEPEKVIAVHESMLKILDAVTDDKPSSFDEYFETTYECIAYMYARLGDKENSVYNIKKFLEYAVRLNENEHCIYGISPLFDCIDDEKYKPYKGGVSLLGLFNNSERKEYEIIRNEPEIIELIKKYN